MIGLFSILVVGGCGGERGWTNESALTDVLERMDADGDGRVGAADYLRLQRAGRPFTEVDRDGDGRLSAAELAEIVALSDPSGGAPSSVRRAPDGASIRAAFPRTWEQRMEAERSLFTREILAAGASIEGWPAPSEAAESRTGAEVALSNPAESR